MRRLSVAPVLAGLVLALTTWGTPGTAEAAAGDRSRAGFCVEGEGLAVVLYFRAAPRDRWPQGNSVGYEVRCLSGPSLSTLNLSAGSDGTQYSSVPGLANMSKGSFDLTMEFSATGGTIRDGWSIQRNTPWPSGENVDKFVGFTYSPEGRAEPVLQPRFARPGADSGSGQTPTPGDPSTGGGGGGGGTPDRVGGGTPDRVGDPDRAGDDDESGDPEDPDARAPGGEARAEGGEETPEATEAPESNSGSDEAVAGTSQEVESTDSLTGGPTWLWVAVIALVVLVYLAVTWLVLRARKAARLSADS